MEAIIAQLGPVFLDSQLHVKCEPEPRQRHGTAEKKRATDDCPGLVRIALRAGAGDANLTLILACTVPASLLLVTSILASAVMWRKFRRRTDSGVTETMESNGDSDSATQQAAATDAADANAVTAAHSVRWVSLYACHMAVDGEETMLPENDAAMRSTLVIHINSNDK